ncbi:hypothetical protein KLA_17454 [Cellulophaga geojensis KL-A]|uniref:Uncharacterized protein n=1 Tax=Cellulophaga geojensis KL-A TaxID=1328323 RepID=A0ABN0RJ25_9FLAO|nr:hypothetical protein [Cellulophaga geojensis]EWH08797.1 hypothetical protein KLA_17454 [Cellulophaga geojensis KL-A]
MTFKEFFDIEPIQKNGILVFSFSALISFLQLYLFKTGFVELDNLDKIILSLSVGVCWVVAELPTYLFFVNSKWLKWKSKGKIVELFPDRIIASFGFSLILWMVLLTYIGYEFNVDLKMFIRISMIWMFGKSIYWLLYWAKYILIDNKKENKKTE